jgi:hypothetical protein
MTLMDSKQINFYLLPEELSAVELFLKQKEALIIGLPLYENWN